MYLYTLGMQRQDGTVGLHVSIYPRNVEIDPHSRLTCIYLPSECRGRLTQKTYMYLSTLGMQRQADTVGLHVSIYPRNVEIGQHSRVTCFYLPSECRDRPTQQGYMFLSTLRMQRQTNTVGLHVSIYPRNVEIGQHSRVYMFLSTIGPSECRDRPTQQKIGRHSRATCFYLPSECRGRLAQQGYMYLSTLGMQRQADTVGLHVSIYPRNVEVG